MKIKTSSDGQYLVVLDELFTAAVFKQAAQLQGQRPMSSHDFKQEPIGFNILSGAQAGQIAIIGGYQDGSIGFLLAGIGSNNQNKSPLGGQQTQVARGRIPVDPDWQKGHLDPQRQQVQHIFDLRHATPNSSDLVACSIDPTGEVKIW